MIFSNVKEHGPPLFKPLLWLPISLRRRTQTLCVVHKALIALDPQTTQAFSAPMLTLANQPPGILDFPQHIPAPSVSSQAFAQAIASAQNLFPYLLDCLPPDSFRFYLKHHFLAKPFLITLQVRTCGRAKHLSTDTLMCQFFFFISMSPLQDTMFKENKTMSVCVHCCIPRACITMQLAHSRHLAP